MVLWFALTATSVASLLERPRLGTQLDSAAAAGHFRFEVLHHSKKPGSRARVGRIHTPHGIIDTPGFVPVGTNAAIKAMTAEQTEAAGVQLMFANTYHLLVHPGPDVVAEAGGLHRFMRREGPLITDSGGFQVFSLARTGADDGPELKRRSETRSGRNDGLLLRTGEKGVAFRSYFDSSTIQLTPESSVAAQKALGADIIIPLDELPANGVSRGLARLERARLAAAALLGSPRRQLATLLRPRCWPTLLLSHCGIHRDPIEPRACRAEAGRVGGALSPLGGALLARPPGRRACTGNVCGCPRGHRP